MRCPIDLIAVRNIAAKKNWSIETILQVASDLELSVKETTLRSLFQNMTTLAEYESGGKGNYAKKTIVEISSILGVSYCKVIGNAASPEQKEFYTQLSRNSPLSTLSEKISAPEDECPAPNLIGRKSETDEIVELITSKGFQVVSIISPPGVGKTELSKAVARNVENSTEWKVRFIDMTVAASEPGIPYEVAKAFTGADRLLSSQAENLQSEMGYFLKDQGDTLLVLDNIEQVAQFSLSTFCVWLSISPKLRLVITSRCIVNTGHSRLRNFVLKPLDHATLDQCAQWPDEQIARTDGFQLFKSGGEDLWADFRVETLSSEEIRTAGRIVAKCGGFPASIAMSTELIRFYDLHQIEETLSGEVFNNENQHERRALHNALRSLLEMGLTKEERAAFYQLSNFVGGFNRTAFESIVSRDEPKLKMAWIKLISYNLIRPIDTTTKRREKLMGFYLPIKEYAEDCWTESANLKTTERHNNRFRDYYVAEAKRLDLLVRSEKRAEVLRQIADIRENLLKIVNVDIAANRPTDALESLLSVRESFRLKGPAAVYLSYIERLYGFKQSFTNTEMAALVREHATILWNLGEFGQASEKIRAALQLVDNLGHHIMRAKCLEMLAFIPGGEYGPEYYRHRLETERKAKEIYINIGNKQGLLLNGGNSLDWLGKSKEAIAAYESSVRFAKESGDPYQIARLTSELGLCLWRNGLPSQAIERLNEAKDIFESLEDENYIGGCLTNMGLAFTDIGETEDEIERSLTSSLDRFERGKRLFENTSNRSWLAVNLVGQMRMLCREKSFADAIEWGEEHRFAIMNCPYQESHALFYIVEGVALMELGEYDKSARTLTKILDNLAAMGAEKTQRGFAGRVCLAASLYELGDVSGSKEAAALADRLALARDYSCDYRVKYVRERYTLLKGLAGKLELDLASQSTP